ncbi:MAG TPA: DUF1854 domain-containing protein [Lacipirellulaceae bacterium]|nr:DUF1854 domain-containing protein [Lacipirellulaceae bacterium]
MSSRGDTNGVPDRATSPAPANGTILNGRAFPEFGLARDQWGQLVYIGSDGVRHPNVAPVPLFPISDPDTWISIRAKDGTELNCIEDPRRLPADVWGLLKEELARREFVPVIERIVWASGNSEPCEWQVETDRGPTQFVLKSEEDVRRLGDHQILIVDAHGTRYHIPDLRMLDAKSRRIVEWYV